jgi:hypothetical protein
MRPICEDQRVRTPLPPVAAVIGFIDAINRGDVDVLVLGSTTGSHLGLSDREERQLKVIWRATVRDGLLSLWQIIEDTPEQRALLGLTDA